jgi:hypothetical protein
MNGEYLPSNNHNQAFTSVHGKNKLFAALNGDVLLKTTIHGLQAKKMNATGANIWSGSSVYIRGQFETKYVSPSA